MMTTHSAVPDNLAVYHVNDVFRDVRGVVGNSLNVPRDEQQLQEIVRHAGILFYHPHYLNMHPFVQIVNIVIFPAHLEGEFLVKLESCDAEKMSEGITSHEVLG